MSTIKGIDISEFQTVTDWAKVKAAGIKFVIIRTGFGVRYTDEQFVSNMKGAIAQGIPIGIYHFSYALNAAGAKAEAERVISLIAPYKKYVTLPVYFDFEYDTVTYAKKQGVTLGRQAFNDHSVAFCDTIQAAGYRAGVYYNLDYLDRLVDMSRIGKYSLWFAQYNSYAQSSGWDVWQYSSSGSVAGISGRVDMNQADESFLKGAAPQTYTEGWQKTDGKWWYRYTDGSYPSDCWKLIGGKWYHFDKEGYMETNKWIYGQNSPYYVGDDGAMVAGRALRIDEDGKLVPAGGYYVKISEVPKYYRETVDKLVSKGLIKGKSGAGEDLVLDMSEDAVRNLVILDRAGVFG
jgi:GH25 family lysozyme M1 (1,4-beta-N-acetylmuramidase)